MFSSTKLIKFTITFVKNYIKIWTDDFWLIPDPVNKGSSSFTAHIGDQHNVI